MSIDFDDFAPRASGPAQLFDGGFEVFDTVSETCQQTSEFGRAASPLAGSQKQLSRVGLVTTTGHSVLLSEDVGETIGREEPNNQEVVKCIVKLSVCAPVHDGIQPGEEAVLHDVCTLVSWL